MEAQRLILQWAEDGLIPAEQVTEALAVAGVTPTTQDWKRFLDRLLLWSGTTFLAVGIIFFIASNWNALGRYLKFGLVEVLIGAALFAYWRVGSERAAGKAALLFATLLLGALLALFGQTYQSGADTWELFATWAALIFPWVLVSRLPALWMVWLGLLNLAIGLYLYTFPSLLGFMFDDNTHLLWVLFTVNTTGLVLWEIAARRLAWLNERWAVRLLAAISGGLITSFVVFALFDNNESVSAFVIYLVWLLSGYAVYRHLRVDLFMLTVGCVSIIVSLTIFFATKIFTFASIFSPFLIAFFVIGISAAAAMWLRSIATDTREEPT